MVHRVEDHGAGQERRPVGIRHCQADGCGQQPHLADARVGQDHLRLPLQQTHCNAIKGAGEPRCQQRLAPPAVIAGTQRQ